MALTTAAGGFAWDWQNRFYLNRLWEFIGKPFSDSITAREGDGEFDEALYCERRMDAAGAKLDDIFDHVAGSARTPFVLRGPPGIGKTTFLKRMLRERARTAEWAAVYLDLDRERDECSDGAVRSHIFKLAMDRFGEIIKRANPTLREWQRFVIDQGPDPTGDVALLREGIEAEGWDEWRGAIVRVLQDLKAEPLDVLRLQFQFIRQSLKKMPVLVVDNCDQLSSAALRELVRVSRHLAEGPQGSEFEAQRSAAVLVALRPVSFGTLPQEATAVLRFANVSAPVIGDVLRLRLEQFMKTWPRRVAPVLSGPDGIDRKTAEQLAGGPRESLDQLARDAVRNAVEALMATATEAYEDPIGLVHTLVNHNTRLALIAAAHYVASGHLELDDLLAAIRGGTGTQRALSGRKVLRALMLGVRPIYARDQSWLVNLFNDARGPDEAAALLRYRMLQYMVSFDAEVSPDRCFETLVKVFDYSQDRVVGVWKDLMRFELLHENKPDTYAVTAAGKTYFARMAGDFEYLQQVAVDVFVDGAHVVDCNSIDEHQEQRFLRVLRLGQWLRRCEAKELRLVAGADVERLFDSHFSSRPASHRVAEALRNFLDSRKRSADWGARLGSAEWRQLGEECAELFQSSTLDELRKRPAA